MDVEKQMVIIKNSDKTEEIEEISFDSGKWSVKFYKKDKVYEYSEHNAAVFNNPLCFLGNSMQITNNGFIYDNVEKYLVFNKEYIRILFKNGSKLTLNAKDVKIEKNILKEENVRECMNYFYSIANNVGLISNDGNNILLNKIEKIGFIGKKSALLALINKRNIIREPSEFIYIYPFGINLSQEKAVRAAFENQISVIEGPPGTGKTQTILNIIANAVYRGKKVAVVSNNNSATKNVLEKLKKNNLDFIAAFLGSTQNKIEFINSQNGIYPDLSQWEIDSDLKNDLFAKVNELQVSIKEMLENKNKLVSLKHLLSALEIEKKYFEDIQTVSDENKRLDKLLNWVVDSKGLMKYIVEYEDNGIDNKIGIVKKIFTFINYGYWAVKLYSREYYDTIIFLKNKYYEKRTKAVRDEIKQIEDELKKYSFEDCLNDISEKSMILFKDILREKYKSKTERKKFAVEDLYKNAADFNREYPVVLSTTYSLLGCLDKNYKYDYVIIDEASQVDIVTGALALSCGENAVIVGDLKQLPNVISEDTKKQCGSIFNKFNLSDDLNYANNSLLSSVLLRIENVSKTLLKEHYRCHPKIIEFCNHKFYNDELVVMTEDSGENDVLKVYKTNKGSHERDRVNQRQIDVIKKEVIPEWEGVADKDSIGIISPYRAQTNALKYDCETSEIEVDTVHKFQGREKDNIILTTVDDELTEFTDNPNMLNVAVSRAVKRLCVVVSDNEKNDNTNIGDLIKYIQYNNFEIKESNVNSVFDLLYKEYYEERMNFLKNRKRISQYDSEELMYNLIKDILKDEMYSKFDVVGFYPLKFLAKDLSIFDYDEKRFIENKSHIDFVIFNKMDKYPVLAIEVDGYAYHKEGTAQSQRDVIKNRILAKLKIYFLRFKTNGSGEEEKIRAELNRYIINN